jgi:hypothetical protein
MRRHSSKGGAAAVDVADGGLGLVYEAGEGGVLSFVPQALQFGIAGWVPLSRLSGVLRFAHDLPNGFAEELPLSRLSGAA